MAAQYDLDLLKSAIVKVLEDESFQMPTENAQRACLVADRLLKWMEGFEEEEKSKFFATELLKNIRMCCTNEKPVSCQKLREAMWEKYHKLCSGDKFEKTWTEFLESTIGVHSVIFYQYVTKKVFEEQIKRQFPVESTKVTLSVDKLDYEESNALRYCGGYILKAVQKKVNTSAHLMKKELLLCIKDVLEGSDTEAEIVQPMTSPSSADWTLSVNRGGLIVINELMFNFFLSLEQEVRRHITIANARIDLKELIVSEALNNDDIMCYWEMISINWNVHKSKELLNLIIKQYVIVRGYSFVSGFMELYKQSKKKSTQKSKALRKTLNSTNVCHDE